MVLEKQGNAGPLALVGSGEYLPVMEETDRALLERLGPHAGPVVVLPTASGLEAPESGVRWARMGIEHFGRLGAAVEAALIYTRADARDPRWLPLLERARFFYFSGGDPRHLIETMTGSLAWEVIERRHREGAALAGCSAGAMALCGKTTRFRALREEGTPVWMPALGVLPHLIVIPHFDRLAKSIGAQALGRVRDAVPMGSILLGIDEDTALVCLDAGSAEGAARWQVTGRGSVAVFGAAGAWPPVIHRAGQSVALPTVQAR